MVERAARRSALDERADLDERAERLTYTATLASEQLEAMLRAKEELAQSTQASHGAAATAAANLKDLRKQHASTRRAINNNSPYDVSTTRSLEVYSRVLLSKIDEATAILTATTLYTGTSAVDDGEQSVRSHVTSASSSAGSSARTCEVDPPAPNADDYAAPVPQQYAELATKVVDPLKGVRAKNGAYTHKDAADF